MKEIKISEQDYEFLKKCKELLNTQDNRCTANPIYAFQCKKRIYGISRYHTDEYVWYELGGDVYDVWETDEELYEYLMDEFYDELVKNWYVYCDKFDNEDKKEDDVEFSNWVKECIEKNYIDDLGLDTFQVGKLYWRYEYHPYNNSFSFFEADSDYHWKNNSHNMDNRDMEHHSYVYSNFRTPMMNQLRKLLMNIELGDENNVN